MKPRHAPDAAVAGIAVLAAATCCLGPLLLAAGASATLSVLVALGVRLAVPLAIVAGVAATAITWLALRKRRQYSYCASQQSKLRAGSTDR